MKRAFASFFVLGVALSPAQERMHGSGPGGAVVLYVSDQAVLDTREPRQDVACQVEPIGPILGFDLRHHAGYQITIPLDELSGAGRLLTILFRVKPENGEPAYFVQKIPVPSIQRNAKGEAVLYGGFDAGEGKYHIDWLMRDVRQRFCSAYWDIEVKLSDEERSLEFPIPAGAIQQAELDLFTEEPPVPRATGEELLHVKILLNLAPQDSQASTMRPVDIAALVSVLRNISRDPNVGEFSLVAFNLHERRVIHRQDRVARIDFPALGKALESLSLGTVDAALLAQPHGETDFLEELVRRETAGQQHPDALVFVGPKAMLEKDVPREALAEIGRLDFPVFYLNCNLYPRRNPWSDTIAGVVKFFKGSQYVISRPKDVFVAVKEMMSRITKSGRRQSPRKSGE